MNIGKSNKNFKNRKPKFFNCNKYGHMVKECWLKKEQAMRKCFKCDKKVYISKDYKGMQSMKKCKVQEESNNKDEEKEQGFGNNLEQVQYKRSPM